MMRKFDPDLHCKAELMQPHTEDSIAVCKECPYFKFCETKNVVQEDIEE